MSEKAKELQKKLFNKKENGVDFMSDEELKVCDDFCEGYKKFLFENKTEREFAASALKLAQEHGFTEFDKFGKALEPGDKVYYFNREKAIILAVKGKRPICDGVRISAAHIDSPRLDLKQCPVYEDGNLGFFKTHYYGGIKKYQWTAIPLSLHGRLSLIFSTFFLKSTALLKEIFFLPSLSLCRHFRLTISDLTEA